MGLEEAKDALAQAVATLGELAEELPPNLRHPWKDVIETDLLRPLEQLATRLHTVLDPIAMSESTCRLKMGRGAGLKAGSLPGRAKPSCAQVSATRLTRGRLLRHATTGCVVDSHPSRVEPPALLLENRWDEGRHDETARLGLDGLAYPVD
jgi:hypothetical protein